MLKSGVISAIPFTQINRVVGSGLQQSCILGTLQAVNGSEARSRLLHPIIAAQHSWPSAGQGSADRQPYLCATSSTLRLTYLLPSSQNSSVERSSERQERAPTMARSKELTDMVAEGLLILLVDCSVIYCVPCSAHEHIDNVRHYCCSISSFPKDTNQLGA